MTWKESVGVHLLGFKFLPSPWWPYNVGGLSLDQAKGNLKIKAAEIRYTFIRI